MIRAALLGAAVAAACSSRPTSTPGPSASIDAAPAPAGTRSDAAPAVAAAGPIPAASRLLITSTADGWNGTAADLALWRRDADGGAWQRSRGWRGALGHAGLAWGDGHHGSGPPAGQAGPVKREGDGKSPAGVFALGDTYGYGAAAPRGAAMPYTQVDDRWRCVDDSGSQHYTRIVDERTVEVDWSSAEAMRRDDALYTWVIDVAHNRDARPRRGSCIFLHVWRAPGSATTGCTAMAARDIEALLAELDPGQAPVLVQLPVAAYDGLAEAWRLPARR